MDKLHNYTASEIEQALRAVRAAIALKRAETEEAINFARKAALEREVVGRSIKLFQGRNQTPVQPNFAAPAKRKKEYRSTTGLRTFHFGWSSVTKSSAPKTSAGTRVYANAAASHIVYIEDGAIARSGYTVYIDGSRVETTANGERLVFSNISDHYEERVEFFRLVDQFERVNHGDKVEIDFAVNAARWAAVVSDADCDPAVVEAFKAGTEGSPHENIALLGSAADLRAVMAKHGFTFEGSPSNATRLKRDGFCFHDGRGGRTEYRLVFELPREFNRKQRAEALKLLCRRFEEAGCMYVAVIHAPDPHNDQDNYHIHLDFYDRRCRRLDGTERDLENVKPQFQSYIAAEMAQGRFRAEARRRDWDFTVVRTYTSNKKKKTHRPFAAAHKSVALRKKSFVWKVREGFAKDINAVGRDAGLGDLYDPRDYAAMGIASPPSKKLHPKKHGQETKGIPTSIGLDNETVQARFEASLIERAYQDRCRHIDEVQLRWQGTPQQTPPDLRKDRQAVEDELARARQAAEIRRELNHLGLELERERSRARLVSDRQGRASRTGTPAAQARSETLARQADDYLAKLEERDRALVSIMAKLEPIANAHGPEQMIMAVEKYERLLARRASECKLDQPSDNKAVTPGRRNIMIKHGALAPIANAYTDAAVSPSVAPIGTEGVAVQLPSTSAPATPNAPIALTASRSAGQDIRPSEPATGRSFQRSPEAHRSALDSVAQEPSDRPRAPLELQADRTENQDVSSLEEQPGKSATQDVGAHPVNSIAADRTSKAEISIEVHIEPERSSSAPQPSANLTPKELTALGRVLARQLAEGVQPEESQTRSPASSRVTDSAVPAERRTAALGTAAEGLVHAGEVHIDGPRKDEPQARSSTSPAREQTPSPAGSSPTLTSEEVREMLRWRRVGPDGVFTPVDRLDDDGDRSEGRAEPTETMDPITTAKLLWYYEGWPVGARERLATIDKDLLAQAEAHPRVIELQAALAQGRRNRGHSSRQFNLDQAAEQPSATLPTSTEESAGRASHQLNAARLAQQSRGLGS